MSLVAVPPPEDDDAPGAASLRSRRGLLHRGERRANRRQAQRGALTARERLSLLFDDGEYIETQAFAGMPGEGEFHGAEVLTAWGRVHGASVAAYAFDFRVQGGSLSPTGARKITDLLDLAERGAMPVVAVNDGAGARIQEGVLALDGYGRIFRRIVRLSGVVPMVSVVAGPCAGGAAYAPALTDFTLMVEPLGSMYVTGPAVVEQVTGEEVSIDELGGSEVHTRVSGGATASFSDEADCFDYARVLLSYLPRRHDAEAPRYEPDDDPDRVCPAVSRIVPEEPTGSYDVREVLEEVVDDGEVLELMPAYAPSLKMADH